MKQPPLPGDLRLDHTRIICSKLQSYATEYNMKGYDRIHSGGMALSKIFEFNYWITDSNVVEWLEHCKTT